MTLVLLPQAAIDSPEPPGYPLKPHLSSSSPFALQLFLHYFFLFLLLPNTAKPLVRLPHALGL